MTEAFPLLKSACGAILAVAVVVAVQTLRVRRRRFSWTPDEAARLQEIQEAIGKASVLRNVDPWGEVAAAHCKRLTEGFERFAVRTHRVSGGEPAVRLAGSRLYLECMEVLLRASALLHRLTLADPAYYRDILQSEEGVGAADYQTALRELATIQGLEESIQQELLKSETAIVAFSDAVKALELRQDPSAGLEAASARLKNV